MMRKIDAVEKIINALLPEVTIPDTVLAQARMTVDAKSTILNSGEFVLAGEIAKLAGYSANNPSAQPNRWKREGAIFAIHYKRTYISRYMPSTRTRTIGPTRLLPKSCASSVKQRTVGAWRFGSQDSMVSWKRSVRRIFSLPILSKSSPRPRTRSRAFSMARRVADNTMHDNLVGWTCWTSSGAQAGYR